MFQNNAFQPDAFQSDSLVVKTQEMGISLLPPLARISAAHKAGEQGLAAVLLRPHQISFRSPEVVRDMPRLKPAYLVEITLRNGGPTLYLSDKNIEMGSVFFEDYISEVSGIGGGLRRADSAGGKLVFKNDPFRGYEHLVEIGEEYPFEAAECAIKEVYMDDAGSVSTPEIVFKGVLDQPEEIGPLGFKCKISSAINSCDRRWKQDVVDTDAFPSAYEDVGKIIPIVYGGNTAQGAEDRMIIPALRTDWGARTTLKAAMTNSQASLELSDASRFPASGSVWIDEEKIGYTSKNGNSLNGCTRGQAGSANGATAHGKGARVWEHKSVYESVLAGHELCSVGDIYAEIGGGLLRVDSGVSVAYEGGRHILRASEQIRVRAVEETVSVTNPAHSHDTENTSVKHQAIEGLPMRQTVGTSYGDLIFDASFNSFAGQRNSVQYKLSVTLSNCQASGNPYLQVSVGGYEKYYKLAEDISFDYSGHVTVTFTIGAGGAGLNSDSLRIKYHTGGGGGGMIVHAVDRSVSTKTSSDQKTPDVARTGDIVGTHWVERFHASVSGYKDPDGNYGGLNNLIERPDYVIKHFLVRRLGFDMADIDGASFDAAGAFYASAIEGGYGFGLAIDGHITPSEFLQRLAFECRSTLKYEKGRWRLDYVPDSAPEAVKTIAGGELAGDRGKFIFDKTPVRAISNDLTAKFKKNYSSLYGESPWDGTAKASDPASQAKYGTYPKGLSFIAIRSQLTAESVLSHILLQNRSPRLIVSFPVFWEHFDLNLGDTIEIDNPLYGGRGFYIEGTMRTKKRMGAVITAREWW